MAEVTTKGVGWISQVRIKPDDADPLWMSWTQWKEQGVAERHALKLLERPDAIESRVVRVDWTPGPVTTKESATR